MSILISQNLTVNTTPGDLANRPLILVENVFQLGTVTASSEVGADNGWLENAVDGMTYDWWKWSALPATLEVTLSTAYPVDMCAIGLHTGVTFVFQYYNGSAWVNLHEAVTTTTTAVHAVIFTEITASRFRINVTAADDENILGLVMLGKAIQLPKTFYGGHAPITLNRTTQLVRNRTENGFDAGVYSLRTGAATSVQIDNMKPAWIRNNLESLNKQLEIRPFVFAWRPSTFPNDVAYCWLNSPIKAENSGPRDLMSLSFDVQAFVGGGIVPPAVYRLLLAHSELPRLTAYVDVGGNYELTSQATGQQGNITGMSYLRQGLVVTTSTGGTLGDRITTYAFDGSTFTKQPTPADVPTNPQGCDLYPVTGKYLAVSERVFDSETTWLYVRATAADGLNYWSLLDKTLLGLEGVRFSPDGNYLATTYYNSGIANSSSVLIYSFNSETGATALEYTIQVNPDPAGQGPSALAWSPDSIYLAVLTTADDRFKMIKNTDGVFALVAGTPTIATGTSGNTECLKWNNAGDYLAVGTSLTDKELILYKRDGDTLTDATANLSAQPWAGSFRTDVVTCVAWSPDDSVLVVGRDLEGNAFAIYDVVGDTFTLRETYIEPGGTANAVSIIRSAGSLNAIDPELLDFVIELYDSTPSLVGDIRATGDYTIIPDVTLPIAVTIDSMIFYKDDVVIGTVTEAPFEATFTLESIPVEPFVIKVDIIDALARLVTKEKTYSPVEIVDSGGWDAGDLPAGVTLSGGGYIVSIGTVGAALRCGGHVTTRNTGKYSIRLMVTCPANNSASGLAVGFRTGGVGAYLGANEAGWGAWVDEGSFGADYELNRHVTSVGYGNLVDFTTAKEVSLDVDLDTGEWWLAFDGTYVNSGNPVRTNVTGNVQLCYDLRQAGTVELLKAADFITPSRDGFVAGW